MKTAVYGVRYYDMGRINLAVDSKVYWLAGMNIWIK
jgi:hypothetical protein